MVGAQTFLTGIEDHVAAAQPGGILIGADTEARQLRIFGPALEGDLELAGRVIEDHHTDGRGVRAPLDLDGDGEFAGDVAEAELGLGLAGLVGGRLQHVEGRDEP